MDIPIKVRIPLSIEQGSVFNFHIEFDGVGRKSGNRYFVVMNCNPKTDKVLVVLTSTTQIENDGSMNYPKNPEQILKKLIAGVKESPLITEEIKKLLD